MNTLRLDVLGRFSGDVIHMQRGTETLSRTGHPSERRQHPRYASDIEARCFVDGFAAEEVRIIDISDGGFGIDRSIGPDVGRELTIDIAGVGRFACVVAWKSAERCGVKLLPQAGDLSATQSAVLAESIASLAGSRA